MRYSNAINTPGSDTEWYPMTYVHPNGVDRTEFELQQVRYEDGRAPAMFSARRRTTRAPGLTIAQHFWRFRLREPNRR